MDDLLDAAREQVESAVLGAHLGLALLAGLGHGGVAAQGLLGRYVE